MIEKQPYQTTVGLFIHAFNEVSSNLVGTGNMLPTGTTVYLDQEINGWYIFHCLDYVTVLGNNCYVKVPEDYLDENIKELDENP